MSSLVLIGSCQNLATLQRLTPLHDAKARVESLLLEMQARNELRGALVLATCNRFEVVADLATSENCDAISSLFEELANDLPLRALTGQEVVGHLLSVATGLQSLVLGEDQILGQVGQAFRDAESANLLSRRLHMLWSRIMHGARKLRAERPVVAAPRSVAELGARLAREAGPRVAIIGCGRTGRDVAEVLVGLGPQSVHFVNRTAVHAESLARHHEGTFQTMDQFLVDPPEVDAAVIAISGRSLHLPVRSILGLHTVIDISQPSVVAGLGELYPDLRIIDLDALAELSDRREGELTDWADRSERKAEAIAVRTWQEIDGGQADLGQIVDLHLEQASAEVHRAVRSKLRDLTGEQLEEVRRLAERVAKRNAHLHLKDLRHFVRS